MQTLTCMFGFVVGTELKKVSAEGGPAAAE